jgi:hypothetical protein
MMLRVLSHLIKTNGIGCPNGLVSGANCLSINTVQQLSQGCIAKQLTSIKTKIKAVKLSQKPTFSKKNNEQY